MQHIGGINRPDEAPHQYIYFMEVIIMDCNITIDGHILMTEVLSPPSYLTISLDNGWYITPRKLEGINGFSAVLIRGGEKNPELDKSFLELLGFIPIRIGAKDITGDFTKDAFLIPTSSKLNLDYAIYKLSLRYPFKGFTVRQPNGSINPMSNIQKRICSVLANKRCELGFSVDDVSDATEVPAGVIQAMEALDCYYSPEYGKRLSTMYGLDYHSLEYSCGSGIYVCHSYGFSIRINELETERIEHVLEDDSETVIDIIAKNICDEDDDYILLLSKASVEDANNFESAISDIQSIIENNISLT